jgi:hypothetical protein
VFYSHQESCGRPVTDSSTPRCLARSRAGQRTPASSERVQGRRGSRTVRIAEGRTAGHGGQCEASLSRWRRFRSCSLGGAALRLVRGGYVQVRPLGAVTVKGLETPTQVYELTGVASARSRLQARAARGLTRFVGRESELQQLAQALERAASGYGQAVAVVGEAGVGKSRLVWEFAHSHRTQGWLVLENGSIPYGRATPYLPVIGLLKSWARFSTGKRWPSASHVACAPSSPTATSAWPSSAGAQASASRPRNASPRRRRCAARWTCRSGWTRRRGKEHRRKCQRRGLGACP